VHGALWYGGKALSISAAILALAHGKAWTAAQQLPAPAELPPVHQWPGWQEFIAYRNALRWSGGLVLGLIALLVFVHLAVYRIRSVRPTGHRVKRYALTEIALHAIVALSVVTAWATSTYFILAKHLLGYGASGIALPFGRVVNTLHIVSGLVFLVAFIPLAASWRSAMRFAPYDRDWLRRFGGYFSQTNQILPAGRFNAGQKLWFRLSILLGILTAASGGLVYYPALLGPSWSILFYVAHTALGVLLSAGLIVHVYAAVLVHPQAAWAMVAGHVDEACLREEHPFEPIRKVADQGA